MACADHVVNGPFRRGLSRHGPFGSVTSSLERTGPMAMMARLRRHQRDESGAILPTAALMLVALSAFAGLALAGATAAADSANRVDGNLYNALHAPSAADPVVTKLQDATTAAGILGGKVVTQDLLTQIQTLNTTLGGALTPLLQYFNQYGGIS